MEHILKIEPRKTGNKSSLKKLRAELKIPAVVYGAHQSSLAISLREEDFLHQFKHVSESTIITLQLGKKSIDVLVKDYDQVLSTNKIRHIDFYAIEADKTLKTHVPVVLVGTPHGVLEGGILEHVSHEIEVECLPSDLPEEITYDCAHLGIGDTVHIRDFPQIKGVSIITHEDQVVVHVAASRITEIVEDTTEDMSAVEESTEDEQT